MQYLVIYVDFRLFLIVVTLVVIILAWLRQEEESQEDKMICKSGILALLIIVLIQPQKLITTNKLDLNIPKASHYCEKCNICLWYVGMAPTRNICKSLSKSHTTSPQIR